MKFGGSWTSIVALAAISVVVVGCGKGGGQYVGKPMKEIEKADVAPGKEAELFPMTEGNQWTYEVAQEVVNAQRQQSASTFTITFKMTKVVDGPNGKTATIEILQDDKVTDRQVWALNDKGIYQVSLSMKGTDGQFTTASMTPIQPALLFPVKAGQKFSWKGKGPTMIGGLGDMNSESEVSAPQEVDTVLGKRFSAIPVSSSGKYKTSKQSGRFASTIWFAPKVGIVRLRQEVLVQNQLIGGLTFRLKAYVVK